MVLRLLVVLAFLPAVAAAVPYVGCLSCHPSHYREIDSCTGCHRGLAEARRKELAHTGILPSDFVRFTMPDSQEVSRGKRLAEQFGCRRCHTVAGKGSQLAYNLDKIDFRLEETATALREPAVYMPRFNFADREIIDLVNYLFFSAKKQSASPISVEVPRVVHFDEINKNSIFAKKCGSCHKAITAKWGGVGTGEMGPNLSGLLSSFYPPTHGSGTRWSEKRLKVWLNNPRQIRGNSRMQPVALDRTELHLLVQELTFSTSPLDVR